MDLEKQLKEFYYMLDFNPLSTNAITLYLVLLIIAVVMKWKKELSVANITLMSKTKLSIKELQCARNELLQKKYIEYKKGRNQNEAPKYRIPILYKNDDIEVRQAEGTAKDIPKDQAEVIAEGTAKGNIYITKLNLLFIILIENSDQKENCVQNIENISKQDRKAIIQQLKRLEIYISNKEILNYLSDEQVLEYKIQYWTIKELYFSPYKIFLNKLTRDMFLLKFLKTKKYVDISRSGEFVSYFLECLKKEFADGES